MLLSTEEKIEQYLGSVGIDHPTKSFISIVSNVYHRFESQCYDEVHLEIHEASEHWQDVLHKISPVLPSSLRVLDLGTGTGFAASMVLQAYGNRVENIVCQDLSSDILSVCRSRISQITSKAAFIACDVESLSGQMEPFDLVTTNSVLHHVLNLPTFFRIIQGLVKPGGFYIAGHEPSSKFYENKQLYRWTRLYRKWRRLRQIVSPDFYLRKIKLKSVPLNIEGLTNQELLRLGVINAPFAPGIIRQLVDIHVPPSSPATPYWGEPGFSASELCDKYLPDFRLYGTTTYPHIKEAHGRMGVLWRSMDKVLSDKYPAFGANFLMAAQRVSDN